MGCRDLQGEGSLTCVQSSADFHYIVSRRAKGAFEPLISCPRVCLVAASKEVESGITTLGPCVDGQVALLDDEHAGDPSWSETMECSAQDAGASRLAAACSSAAI